jgi:hypothetical protein
MDVDADGFAVLLAAGLAAIAPAGFRVELVDDMLWFRSDEGSSPGQQGDHGTRSTGIWPQEDLMTCIEHDGTPEECAADVAQHALGVMQEYIAEAIHEPWPGQRTMPEPRAQVRDSMLHLWYGDTDNAVLACEPMALGGPEDA